MGNGPSISGYRRFEFIEAGEKFSPVLDSDCAYDGLVPTDDFDTRAYSNEFRFRCAHSVPVGAYRFCGVEISGAWMLVSNDGHAEIHSSLPGMGWSADHIRHAVATSGPDGGRRKLRPLRGKCVLLSFPGAFTYGHALVDMSIRLQLAREMGLWSGMKMLIQGPTPAWFLPLLSVAGVSIDDCIAIENGDSYYAEEVYIPTLTGLDGVLNRSIASLAFRRMKETMNNILDRPPGEKRIVFPLHTTMSSIHAPRGVADRDSIAKTMQQRFDADVFDPLGMPFARQVDKFRNARLVIGEDSSALHNILWSDGADLAVMGPRSRMNYYHIGIQSINGGRCAIQWGDVLDKQSGRFAINVDGFSRTVEALLESQRA